MCSISAHDPIFAWAVRHAACLLNWRQPGYDGKTAYERMHGRPFRQELVAFGAPVMYRVPGTNSGTAGGVMGTRWGHGVWLGRSLTTAGNIVRPIDGRGIVLARDIKQRDTPLNPSTLRGVTALPIHIHPRGDFELQARPCLRVVCGLGSNPIGTRITPQIRPPKRSVRMLCFEKITWVPSFPAAGISLANCMPNVEQLQAAGGATTGPTMFGRRVRTADSAERDWNVSFGAMKFMAHEFRQASGETSRRSRVPRFLEISSRRLLSPIRFRPTRHESR